MGKEVRTYLGNLDPQSRYFPFIRERNNSIAAKIARHQGMPFNANPLMEKVMEKTYIVPGATLTRALADDLLIETEDDFYGTAAPSMDDVGKTILHQTLSDHKPKFHDGNFAKKAETQNLVLPGYSGFSSSELLEAYGVVASENSSYRLKVPNDSDGNGQFRIENMSHLETLLAQIDEDTIAQHGLVIEPELSEKSTASIGQFMLGDRRYVFVADQVNGEIEGRDVYLGGKNIVVARGHFNDLLDILRQARDPRVDSVEKAEAFLRLYSSYHPDVLSSRMSVDVLSGYHPGYGKLSGVTDITGRLGGLCPATILAALELQEKPSLQAVKAQVHLNYDTAQVKDYERGQGVVFFMDQPPLRISARIDKVY